MNSVSFSADLLVADLIGRGVELWLEAGQLAFDAPNGAVDTILREQMRECRTTLMAAIGDGRRLAPASSQVEGAWLLYRLAPEDSSHIRRLPRLAVAGGLRPELVETALRTLIERHEILRTGFCEVAGQLVQVVYDAPTDSACRVCAAPDQPENFDLLRAPLFRVYVESGNTDHSFLHFEFHQIISDGASIALFLREFERLLHLRNPEAEGLHVPPAYQYRNWTGTQRQWLDSVSGRTAITAAADRLSDLPPPVTWPAPGSGLPCGQPISLDAAQSAMLTDAAKLWGVTPFVLLLTAFSRALYVVTEQKEFVIGAPVTGRINAEQETVLGRCVNMIPIILRQQSANRIGTLVRQVAEANLAARHHERVPFERLVDAVSAPRLPGRNPLFQITFGFLPSEPFPDLLLAGKPARFAPVAGTRLAHGFDLALEIWRSGEGLVGRLSGDSGHIGEAELSRIKAVLLNALSSILSCRLQDRWVQERTPADEIARRIQADPLVADVHVGEVSGEQTVWVASESAMPPAALIDRLGAALNAQHVRLVLVGAIPRRHDGTVDITQLGAAVCTDRAQLARWTRVLRKASAAPALSIDLVRRAPVPRRFHISDLVDEHRRSKAHGVSPPVPRKSVRPAFASGGRLPLPGPGDPKTLGTLLRYAAEHNTGQTIRYVKRDRPDVVISVGELFRRAVQLAGGLQRNGLQKGRPALILLDRAEETVDAFWGSVLVGGCPMIHSPSRCLSDIVSVVADLWQRLDGPVIITGRNRDTLQAAMPKARILGLEDLGAKSNNPFEDRASPDAPALLTGSSGTSGRQKIISLSHSALLDRANAADFLCGNTQQDVCLGWLPFSHVGAISDWHIRCLRLGADIIHAETQDIAGSILDWMDLIHRYRVTHSWAPNFAFGLISDAIEAGADPDWDLRHVKGLITGGEAVIPSVIKRFLASCRPYGLSPDSLRPAYGMAELSSGITYAMGTHDEPIRYHGITKCGQLCEPVGSAPLLATDVGTIIPGHQMRIVDDADHVLVEGEVGRLHIRGLGAASGYLGDPEKTSAVFGEDGWVRTGDLGAIWEGRLVVTGRESDTIIVRGSNLPAHDIETAVEAVPGVIPSYTAAFQTASEDGGAPKLVVVFHTEQRDEASLADLIPRIRTSVSTALGITVDVLLPVEAEDVPKTGIGKVQRKALHHAFITGRFAMLCRRVERITASENTVPAFFFQRHWSPCPVGQGAQLPNGPVLLVVENKSLATRLRAHLSGQGLQTTIVLREDEQQAVADLLEETRFSDVIVCSSNADAPDIPTRLLGLLAVFGRMDPERVPRLTMMSRFVFATTTKDPARPVGAALAALVRSARAELPALRSVVLDVGDSDPAQMAHAVSAELSAPKREPEIAWRGGRRFRPRLRDAGLASRSLRPTQVNPGDLVLLVGGLGGVGAHLARHLLQDCGACLLVAGRSDPAEDPVRAKTLQLLRDLGPIDYIRADIADKDALEVGIVAAETRHSRPIRAVFDASGEAPGCAASALNPDTMRRLLDRRVAASRNLHDLLTARSGRTFVTISSVAALFGQAEDAAYAMLAAYQYAFAAWQRQNGLPRARCLAWTQWRGVGMSSEIRHAGLGGGLMSLSEQNGNLAISAAMANDCGDLVIGLDPEHPRIECMRDDANVANLILLTRGAGADVEIAEMVLSDRWGATIPVQLGNETSAGTTAGRAPDTQIERGLAALWRELLVTERIDIASNFFVLGGHSLLAARLVSRITRDLGVTLPLSAVFENQTLGELAQVIEASASVAPQAVVEKFAPNLPVPLAPVQHSLWLQSVINSEAPENLIPLVIPITGRLDPARLRRAIVRLADRHDPLRTSFNMGTNGLPQQTIHARVEIVVNHVRIERGMTLDALVTEAAKARFDLDQAPLFQTCLVQLQNGEHVLLLTLHHLIADGQSLPILMSDLAAFYTGAEPPPLPARYVDVAAQQAARPDTKRDADLAAFWQTSLAGAADRPVFRLPGYRAAPGPGTGAALSFAIAPVRAATVRRVAAAIKATPFIVFLACFAQALRVLSGEEDIVIGTDVTIRNAEETQGLVGYFINQVPLRLNLACTTDLDDVLERARAVTLQAYDHRDLPFDRLVEIVRTRRETGRMPLLSVKIALLEKMPAVFEAGAVAFGAPEIRVHSALVDVMLSLNWSDASGAPRAEAMINYDATSYDRALMERLRAEFLAQLETLDPSRLLHRRA